MVEIIGRIRRVGSYPTLIIRCAGCGSPFEREERVQSRPGLKSKDLCRDCRKPERKPDPTCLDCGKRIWPGSAKCKSCAQRIVRGCCTDCGTPLKSIGAVRCNPCHNIRQDQGRSRERTKFNNSKAWVLVRTACFIRDDFTCRKCRERGGYLHCHHVKSWSNYPELRLNIGNLETWCRACHHALHRGPRDEADRRDRDPLRRDRPRPGHRGERNHPVAPG